MTSSPPILKEMRRSPPLRAKLAGSGGGEKLFAPVNSTFIVKVALYLSGSRGSLPHVLVVVVGFMFVVFEALAVVVVAVFVFVVVLVLLAGCCWHAPPAMTSARAAVVKNLADGFKAKICMRRLSSSRAARAE